MLESCIKRQLEFSLCETDCNLLSEWLNLFKSVGQFLFCFIFLSAFIHFIHSSRKNLVGCRVCDLDTAYCFKISANFVKIKFCRVGRISLYAYSAWMLSDGWWTTTTSEAIFLNYKKKKNAHSNVIYKIQHHVHILFNGKYIQSTYIVHIIIIFTVFMLYSI